LEVWNTTSSKLTEIITYNQLPVTKLEGKMFRTYLFIIVLTMGFVFHGCTTLESFDGGSEKDLKMFQMSKSEMYDALKKLENENEQLQKQSLSAKETNQQLRDENQKKLAHVSERNRSLNQEVDRLKNDNQRITQENEALKQKFSNIPTRPKTAASKNPKVDKNISRLKIKVLFGDGELNSARKMAQRLRSMGYPVQLVDQAPRSNFDTTTIYFAPKSKYEAKRLRAKLGGQLILKPLSWPSNFDLILVTGSLK